LVGQGHFRRYVDRATDAHGYWTLAGVKVHNSLNLFAIRFGLHTLEVVCHMDALDDENAVFDLDFADSI